jgi:hypothetical protein
MKAYNALLRVFDKKGIECEGEGDMWVFTITVRRRDLTTATHVFEQFEKRQNVRFRFPSKAERLRMFPKGK